MILLLKYEGNDISRVGIHRGRVEQGDAAKAADSYLDLVRFDW